MKNLITLAKTLLKPLAVVKYLCFPFMMAQAQGITDLTTLTAETAITGRAETENTTWVATTHGIYKVNKTTGKTVHITTENSVLPSNLITGICSTPNGEVYASTNNGIFRFDGSAFLVISTENAKLPTNSFTAIASDEHGRIFAGTENNGLIMLENYRCQVFNKTNSDLTSNGVINVYRDDNGLIIAELANGRYVAMGNTTLVLIPQQTPDLNATAKGY